MAAEKALEAANVAKQKAFNKFKKLVSQRKRKALILANNLRKLLKHFLFCRDYKVAWIKYCEKKVAVHKIAIFHSKNTIRRLRKTKMNDMVSLGKWLYFLRPGRMLSNFLLSSGAVVPSAFAATAAVAVAAAAAVANTTDADADADAAKDIN